MEQRTETVIIDGKKYKLTPEHYKVLQQMEDKLLSIGADLAIHGEVSDDDAELLSKLRTMVAEDNPNGRVSDFTELFRLG